MDVLRDPPSLVPQRLRLILVTLALLIGACASGVERTGGPDATAYVNGRWYDGERFVERTAYVRDGSFVAAPRNGVAQEVDLNGAYVLPAFGEAHHHTVLCDRERIQQFVRAGVLYAAIMNARVSSRECQARLHGPGSVEVVSALAGFTAPNAHPSQIGLFFLDQTEIDGEWVHYVESEADIDRVWRRIGENRPDFIKIFLSYSEDYQQLRDDAAIEPWYRGLDPALAPLIAERARREGLRVAAHVMSGHDFDVAVHAGVDIIAHMPGFAPDSAFSEPNGSPYLAALTPDSPRYLISRQAARLARTRGVVVISTMGGYPNGASVTANMRTLQDAGVTILIGSDRGEGNSVDEAIFLVESGRLTAAEAVRSLAVTTPRYFFSERELGRLTPGAEATFVVLAQNPLDDIQNLRGVRGVTQRGQALFSAAPH